MADQKISELTENTAPAFEDLLVQVDDPSGSPTTKKMTGANMILNLIKPPSGYLLNGKIVPSVASNNLTVAIKGMDGNDPSTTNPVFVRIADSVRSITSALSVTKNAGTNWCNAGSAELATKEIDYFVYLGYNATDGVVIGFSRVASAGIYSDFSATSTNEKYCAISTITNAAAGDNYENIGRFAATLSAGAGYTWTVPTFTNANLIQKPIFDGTLKDFIPVWTGTGGSAGTYAATTTYGKYKICGDLCIFYLYTTVTNKGSWSGTVQISLPFSPVTNFIVVSGIIAAATANPFTASKGLPYTKTDRLIRFLSSVGQAELDWAAVATNDISILSGSFKI